MLQAFFVLVGITGMAGALIVCLRRRVDVGLYGSSAAFYFHVSAMFVVSAAFVAVGASALTFDAVVLPTLALCVADVVVGVVARRRARAREQP